ncbi:ATP-binding protein [Streptomyces fumanus]|uniref:ATP-binding protein n=1 Tax=Streptomyces fumanus TaxID=67302 RepID=A0A919E4I3_9ACTN|nr:ATP-binding protein [Streptomyces fumanus]GHF12768.1 hypothetical protein GCM10018772_42400 [Streptomyces fumanus]
MKQSAAKTLGAAALGAAIAAAGAGAAQAAPSLPGPAQALGGVTKALPTEHTARTLPAVDGDQHAAKGKSKGKGKAAEQPGLGALKPITGLLGGLPAQGLPTQALPLKALPLG